MAYRVVMRFTPAPPVARRKLHDLLRACHGTGRIDGWSTADDGTGTVHVMSTDDHPSRCMTVAMQRLQVAVGPFDVEHALIRKTA